MALDPDNVALERLPESRPEIGLLAGLSLSTGRVKQSHGPAALPSQQATAFDSSSPLRLGRRLSNPGSIRQPAWTLSASLLQGCVAREFSPAAFRGEFVLVGSTASGMSDALPTPVSSLGYD